MSLATRVILGLIAGLAIGAAIAAIDNSALSRSVDFFAPVGDLWLNALRMTVIPLVVALLITGIASATATQRTGSAATRSLLYFLMFLTASAILGAILTPLVLAAWPVDPDSAAALRAGASASSTVIPQPPPLRDWFAAIIPTNPFGAAAREEMLPLVTFAVLFGFAATRIAPALREPLLGFFQAIAETMLVIVRWVLWVAPLGVFALALGVGFRGGVGAAGALTQYLVLTSAMSVIVMLLFYPIAVILGGVPLLAFARAAVPAQVVGFSTQSSLASLPAMIEGAAQLGLPRPVAGITLPLAVSLFRATSPIVNISVVLFVAHVYGVHLDVARLAAGVVVAVITSFAVVSLPSQISFFTTTVPISLTMGVPVELLALFLAVEVIPDLFRTIGNVTADLAVTAVVARGEPRQ